jgi:hypothetical protein
MQAEDDREIEHFKTGRYPTMLRGTQERTIARKEALERQLEAAERKLEEYREAARKLLSDNGRLQ